MMMGPINEGRVFVYHGQEPAFRSPISTPDDANHDAGIFWVFK